MSVPGHDDYDEHPAKTFLHQLKHATHHLWHGWHLVHQVIAGYGLIEALDKLREVIVENKIFGHGG